jgi:hypothetical protein
VPALASVALQQLACWQALGAVWTHGYWKRLDVGQARWAWLQGAEAHNHGLRADLQNRSCQRCDHWCPMSEWTDQKRGLPRHRGREQEWLMQDIRHMSMCPLPAGTEAATSVSAPEVHMGRVSDGLVVGQIPSSSQSQSPSHFQCRHLCQCHNPAPEADWKLPQHDLRPQIQGAEWTH